MKYVAVCGNCAETFFSDGDWSPKYGHCGMPLTWLPRSYPAPQTPELTDPTLGATARYHDTLARLGTANPSDGADMINHATERLIALQAGNSGALLREHIRALGYGMLADALRDLHNGAEVSRLT